MEKIPHNPNISNERALKLIEASIEIEKQDALDADKVGYMPRIFMQTTLPYRNPKVQVYTRVNGNVKLSLLSTNGVPYGSIPRFLITYLASEAKRTGSPVIHLGRSQNEFMKLLGMKTAGGAQKDRMKEQCKRFFTTMFSVEVARKNEKGVVEEAVDNVLVARKAYMFWHDKKHDELMPWQSHIELTQDFFNECITRPVPVDLRVMDELSTSPMAMDLYVWLTNRVVKARHVSTMPWEYVMLQFGCAEGTEVRTFRRYFIRALKLVQTAASWYPSISLDATDGLTIYPGKGHVLPVKKR